MNLFFQFAVFCFIAFSFLLVIGVPVAFAGGSTIGWNQNKPIVLTGIGLWFGLVLLVGILNSFVV